MKIAILTDTHGGIYQEEAEREGFALLAAPFVVDGVQYTEGLDLKPDVFYKKLQDGAEVSTAQSSPGEITDLWDQLLKEYAFYNCGSLDNIFIPNSVINIRMNAFKYCDSLKTLSIGYGVRYISATAFTGCPFTEIEYRGTINKWQQVDIDMVKDNILYKTIIHCVDGDVKYNGKRWIEV